MSRPERAPARSRWPARLAGLAASTALAASAVPLRDPGPGYVDDALCAGCHAAEAERWRGSHHDLAMQEATPASVLGDFADARATHFGVETRFLRRGDGFAIASEGPDGRVQQFPVRFSFGVSPLQQYLLELPGGRLQAFSLAWDARPTSAGGSRWFPLYPDERIAADDALHWSGHYLNWNAQCAECHSTGLRKRYQRATRSYDTRYATLDVACQACHGPGAAHVEAARARGAAGAAQAGGPGGLAFPFGAAASARVEVDQCARCHSRRRAISAEPDSARAFLDDYLPSLLLPGLYRADGQVEGEVYEYGSFLQSRMYAAGVRCSDCHEPHSLALAAPGNALCTRCHSERPDARFPSLRAARYDAPEHHHHASGTPAAQCVSCHMPEQRFMQIDGRRDHSLRAPRPDLGAKTGSADACGGCHAKRGADWAAAAVARWSSRAANAARAAKPHYGEALAAARAGAEGAREALAALARDAGQPGIARATAVFELGRFGDGARDALLAAARDAEPLVRAAAADSLGAAADAEVVAALAALLDDPVGAVRSESARALAALPESAIPEARRAAWRRELVHYEDAQRANADTPGAASALAQLALQRGDPESALDWYRSALRSDARYVPAIQGAATLLSQERRADDAERALREGLRLLPEEGSLHSSLGLLLAERGALAEAEAALARAEALLPRDARVAYNRGLALQQLGRPGDALAALGRARALEPRNPDFLYALVSFHASRGELAEALPHAEELEAALRAGPPADAARARALLERIRGELARGAPDPPRRGP